MPKEKRTRVAMAMSGGVDSSVAAALLKREGFDVIGVFMKFWSEPAGPKIKPENRCCSSEAEKRARKVAKILKIPFYVLNFEKEFKKRVVDYFLSESKKGLTPNPCVVCNKEIKFGILLEKALSLEADFVATGHYVRKIQNAKSGFQKLLKGKDKQKDQSYFLWQLDQRQLKHILFPAGNYTKTQVRKLAKKFRLPVAGTPESQEICFIQTTINDFLKKHLKKKSGQIVTESKRALGQHEGLWFYTMGQRKGIKLAGGPFYVLDKDLKKNLLIVTKNEKDLYRKELIAKNVNWISGKESKPALKVQVKIRYRHQAVPGTIYKVRNGGYRIVFNKSQRAITPGQSVALYRGQELLGGGIIC